MPSSARSLASALALTFALAACGGRPELGTNSPLAGMAYGTFHDTGLASWYGEEMGGNRTASGERFDPGAMTAAHRSLPLGSFAEVTSVETGRSIIVRINDRGPGRSDRIIDLSRGAAQRLGTDRLSIANVRIRAVVSGKGRATLSASPPAPSYPAQMPVLVSGRRYYLQIAAFSSEARAHALADRLEADVVPAGNLWRVRSGPFADAESLQRARDAIVAHGYGDVQVLPEDRVYP